MLLFRPKLLDIIFIDKIIAIAFIPNFLHREDTIEKFKKRCHGVIDKNLQNKLSLWSET